MFERMTMKKQTCFRSAFYLDWWEKADLNRRPTDYESAALTD